MLVTGTVDRTRMLEAMLSDCGCGRSVKEETCLTKLLQEMGEVLLLVRKIRSRCEACSNQSL